MGIIKFLHGSGPLLEVVPLETGPAARARQLWTTRIPGFAVHATRIHQASGSLFASDGWGVTFASLRFRRYDLRTGTELARIRTGTAVRCLTLLPGATELMVATDSKLFRLSVDALAEQQRWQSRIPRYSNTLVVRGPHAVVANWMHARVAVVDLASGSVRRRDAPEMIKVIDSPTHPLLVGGGKHGGLASIDPGTATVSRLLDTPPAIDAVADATGGIWMTVGVRGYHSQTSTSEGAPSRELRHVQLDGSSPTRSFRVPEAVQDIVLGRTHMWLASRRALVAVPLPAGSAPARVWQPPAGHDIETFDPDAAIVVVVKRLTKESAAMMTAFEID